MASAELSNPSDQGIAEPRVSRAFSRERVVAGLVALAVAFLIAVAGLRWYEYAVTFHPIRFSQNLNWVKPAAAEDVWFRTADGMNLNGWFFSSTHGPAQATIIFFHGNGGNISNVGWLGERLAARGFDVLVFDYRGYGKSSGSPDNEQGLYQDADAAFDYLVKTRGVDPSRMVLYGQSLGTAAVTDLASRHACGAIILESGLSSARDMTVKMLPKGLGWVHVLTRNRFDSVGKLRLVHCPVLVTHGDPDPIIPTDEGRALFAAAGEPKRLLIFPGSGHNVFGAGGDDYLDVISGFIRAEIKQ